MATRDKRYEGESVARYEFAQLSWATGAGHAAKTATLGNVVGMIERVDIIISSVTGNPTVNISFVDQNSVVVLPAMNTLADGTKHMKLAYSNKGTQDADFNAVPHAGLLTVSADPSADAGGEGQTLTVDVILYVR